jgi:hypothetical protein
MDPTKAFLVICLTIIIVLGINAAIYVSIRRGNEAGQVELFRRAAKTARSPWQVEDEALKELSTLVSKYREKHEQDGGETDNDEQ